MRSLATILGIIASLVGSAAVVRDAAGQTPSPPGNFKPRIAPPATPEWTAPPKVWRYESQGRKLAFLQTHNGWREIALDALFTYSKSTQGRDYVELERENPLVKVRLYQDRADVSVRGGEFKTIHRGGWVDELYPFADAVRIAGRGSIRYPAGFPIFRQGSKFQFELWFRPTADMVAGDHLLVNCGPTSIFWTVHDDGKHQFSVQTQGKPSLFVRHDWMSADWTRILLASDGRLTYFAINANGMFVEAGKFLSPDPASAALVIGDARSPVHKLWIDVAAYRWMSSCDVPPPQDASAVEGALRLALEVPDTWDVTPTTQLLASISARKGQPFVDDRSGRGLRGALDQCELIDVPQVPPFNIAVGRSPFDGAPPPGVVMTRPPQPGANPFVPKPAPEPPPAPVQRLPVPSEAQRTAAVDKIREIYKKDYEAAKRAPEKLALANKLGEVAKGTRDEPPAQYALLDQARQLASDAAQTSEAFLWIDALSNDFEVDSFALKVAAARRATEVLGSSANAPLDLRLQLITASIGASNAAVEAERFEEAAEFAQLALAQSKAKQIADADVKRQAKEHADMIAKLSAQWADAKAALQVLASNPDDPDANRAVGRFRCFQSNQWILGLPHLAKSGQPGLVEAAQLELAPGREPKDLLKIAQAWDKAAEAATPPAERREYLARAHKFFASSIDGGLRGLDKEVAKKRLDAIGEIIPPPHPVISVTLPDGTRQEVHRGMIGRVMVGNRDAGAIVLYEPGKPIVPAKIQEILAESKLKGPLTIEFIGRSVTPLRELRVLQRGGGRNSAQRVVVNGQVVSQVDQRNLTDRAKYSPSTQQQTILWQLNGLDATNLTQMDLFDDAQVTRLDIFYTPQMLSAARETKGKSTSKQESPKEYHVTN